MRFSAKHVNHIIGCSEACRCGTLDRRRETRILNTTCSI